MSSLLDLLPVVSERTESLGGDTHIIPGVDLDRDLLAELGMRANPREKGGSDAEDRDPPAPANIPGAKSVPGGRRTTGRPKRLRPAPFQARFYVSVQFRRLALELYPGLVDSPLAEFLRRMMTYLLFTGVVEEDSGRIVVDRDLVAQLVGVGPNDRNFRAQDYLDVFSSQVTDLHVEEYCFVEGKARTAAPEFCARLLEARELERRSREPRNRAGLVDFVTGRQYSRRVGQRDAADHLAWTQRLAASCPENHPAHHLIGFLNNQPPDVMTGYLHRSSARLWEMALAMPTEQDTERRRREAAIMGLTRLSDVERFYYRPVTNSARVFAVGTSLHQLPRSMSEDAFRGAVALDLRSSQLAIVAREWNLPKVQEFLMSGPSFWDEILGYLGLESRFKDLLKRVLYSLIFGMSKAGKAGPTSLERMLLNGVDEHGGIASPLVRKFFRHPIIAALLAGRSAQMKRIKDAGGVKDCFGRWLLVGNGKGQHHGSTVRLSLIH